MKSVILSIEDDPAISAGLKAILETEGYTVIPETDGKKGLEAAINKKPDLIILDIKLPSMSGFDVCKELRLKKINTPVLMLTGMVEEVDKVLGLELGADDYVTKPFSTRELVARVKAVLRRIEIIKREEEGFQFDDVKIEFTKMEAAKGKKKIDLSLKELEIIKFFIGHEGEVVSRNMLLDKVWGFEYYPTTRTVDNYIMMIRKKLETNPSVPSHFLTIHTAGYMFVK